MHLNIDLGEGAGCQITPQKVWDHIWTAPKRIDWDRVYSACQSSVLLHTLSGQTKNIGKSGNINGIK